jgi:hypothetical protein
MNKEIKEILDNVRKIIKSNRESEFNRIIYDCDGIEKILDYITNLEQEKQEMKNGWQQEVNDKDEVLNRWYETQGRIDKAIEYIEKENNEKFYNPTIVFALDRRKEKLLSILRGEE